MFVGPGGIADVGMHGVGRSLLCSVCGVSNRQVAVKASSCELEAFYLKPFEGLLV